MKTHSASFARASLALLLFVGGALAGIVGWNVLRPSVKAPASGANQAHPTATVIASRHESNSDQGTDSIEFPPEMWAAAGLHVEPATKAPLAEAIELTGKVALNEDRLAHVHPIVSGRVDAVYVRFGQQVKDDEPLVVVKSQEVGSGMLQLFQDRLNLKFAEAKNEWTQDVARNTLALISMMRDQVSIEEIEAAFRERAMGDYREKLMTAYVASLRAQGNLRRLSPLSQDGAISGRQVIEAEAERDATSAVMTSLLEQVAQDLVQVSRMSEQTVAELKTSVAVSEANLKILGFTPEQLKEINPATQGEELAHYLIRAPFDGTVISKDVVLLERVGPENQILTIADLSTVWITADIYESHLPLLSQLGNQTVQVKCDAWPDQQFAAKVFYTGDVVQEVTRTLSLRAVADNPKRLLKPGMFVTVTLPNLNTDQVIQVPQSAIQDHMGQSFVFLQTGEGTFARRDVRLGRRNKNSVEVLSGLKAGDPVVTQGGFALKSKMLAELLEE